MTPKILKYKADRRSVAFVSIFILIQGILFLFSSRWWTFPLLALGCAIVGAINHNHMHHRMFVSKSLNELWNFVLSWGMGSSAAQMTVTHILIHHRFFRDSRDWTRYELAKGRGVQRVFSYLKNTVSEIRRHRKVFFQQTRNEGWLKQARREKMVLWIISLCLLAYSPLGFLFCYFLPWIGGLLIVLVVNLTQHDELDLKSDQHSRDFVGPLGNWFAFNSFFHTVHHEKPALHWSLLPLEHRKRALGGRKSFWSYIFTHYLFQTESSYLPRKQCLASPEDEFQDR